MRKYATSETLLIYCICLHFNWSLPSFLLSSIKEKLGERMNSVCLQNLRATNNRKSSFHDTALLSFMKMNKAEKQCLHSYY